MRELKRKKINQCALVGSSNCHPDIQVKNIHNGKRKKKKIVNEIRNKVEI